MVGNTAIHLDVIKSNAELAWHSYHIEVQNKLSIPLNILVIRHGPSVGYLYDVALAVCQLFTM